MPNGYKDTKIFWIADIFINLFAKVLALTPMAIANKIKDEMTLFI